MKCAPLLLLFLAAACASPVQYDAVSSPTRKTLWSEEEEHAIAVRFGDELFTKVHYDAAPRPYLYPLLGPGGVPVTRGWPQEEREDEARDHPHHTSFWFAHGNVNGVDFWHPQSDHGGVIEFTGRLKELLQRGKLMRLRHEYKWKDKQGTELLHERRTTLLGGEEDQRWVDMKFELTALQDEVTFGDTKEGTFALRMHPNLRLKGDVANGKAVNATGVTGKAVWGKRAAWVHYQGEVDGASIGLAIFEHDGNFRHPTWWHAREYGLVGANPFGVHDFERGPAGEGDHVLEKGETLVLQYRVWIHAGHKTPEEVAAGFEVYKIQAADM
jgi:hypothetical protein